LKTASTQVRVHGGPAMFKLYILNRDEAFFGFYPIAEHAVTQYGEPVSIYDLMGKDATMFHYERGDAPASLGGGQYVERGPGLVRQHVVPSWRVNARPESDHAASLVVRGIVPTEGLSQRAGCSG
jgi:hypothetical protein